MLNRSEERAGFIGTLTFHGILILVIILLFWSKACNVEAPDELEAGGVMVSLGEPDLGGEDVSSSQEQVEEVVEEIEQPHQETSDIEEAPAVHETQPTPRPTQPTTTPTTTPTEPTEQPRRPDSRNLFGSRDNGSGSGGGNTGGDRGQPDGSPDGQPDGAGLGDDGEGIDLGSGISGSIRGFKVAKVVPPRGGVQEEGVVRLYVCVDANGNVRASTIQWKPDRDPLTTRNSVLINQAKEAMRKFKFTNTSGSSGGCGYYKFRFKLN